MFDALHVELSPRNPFLPNLPGSVRIAVSLMPIFDMLDALHVAFSLDQQPCRLDLPRSLDLPGSVKIVLRHILIFDMLDVLHVAFGLNQLPCRLDLPRNLNLNLLSSLSLSRNLFLPDHLNLPGSV